MFLNFYFKKCKMPPLLQIIMSVWYKSFISVTLNYNLYFNLVVIIRLATNLKTNFRVKKIVNVFLN